MDLEKFFDEKEIPYTVWEIEHNGITYMRDSDFAIDAILATQGEERKKLASIIFAIDSRNDSIINYLKFIAKLIIINNV